MSKNQTSTQNFTEILDVRENIMLFQNNNACLVIEVYSTNFTLLSKEEQDAKVGGFASFLNSLTFPIQIVVNNRRVDITNYITVLESEMKNIQDEKASLYMNQYKNFVGDLVKQNVVLDKKFYIAVSFSYLEAGTTSAISTATGRESFDDFFQQAKASLLAKAEGIRTQLQRVHLQTKVLEKDELIYVFKELYTPSESVQNSNDIVKSV